MTMLVVGSTALDTIHNHLGTHRRIVGGSAIFASLAGSYYGPVQLVGVVGADFPEDVKEMLAARNIDLSGLEVAAGKTFHWEGRYSDDLTSRTTLKTELNCFADFRPKIPDSFRTTPYVMLGNIDPELQIDVLEQVSRPKFVVADTMNFWIEGKNAELRQMLRRIDLLVINEEEARQLSEVHNIVRAARALHEMGPRIVVIKRGEYGALLFMEEEVFFAAGMPLPDIADPTGAGDSFAGGFLGYLSQAPTLDAETLRTAVIHGSALASICVEGIGIERLVSLDRADIERRVDTFRQLVHFK